jgi:hypothetical protein
MDLQKISNDAFVDELIKIALIVKHKKILPNGKIKWIEKSAEKKSSFQVLKENKVPLSDEERKKVMARKAVWNFGSNGEPSPAVWKSVNKKTGKTTFVTNTHRAYNARPTLEGAISRYHKFIKGTA